MSRLVALPLALGVLASAGLLSACGGGDDASSEDAGDAIAVELEEQNDSNVTGVRVTLEPRGSRTHVAVDGLDEGEPAGGGPNPVHVHRGTCEESDEAEAIEVGTLSGSETASVVDVPIGELVEGYVVDVHLPARGDAPPEAIACGDLAEASQSDAG